MMECLPSGGWFSLGLRPRENHPPSGKHSIMLPPTGMAYLYTITFIICNDVLMTGVCDIGFRMYFRVNAHYAQKYITPQILIAYGEWPACDMHIRFERGGGGGGGGRVMGW